MSLSRLRSTRGFSLTEIAIALATVSVSLVALLGLVSVSIQTGASSAQETCLASASRQALDALRSRKFTDLPYVEPPRSSDESTQPRTLPTIYLSDDGQWLAPDRDKWPEDGKTTDRPPEAVYQCVVEIEPDKETLTSANLEKLPLSQTRVNLLRVKLELGTIAGGPKSTQNSAVLIHATLSRQ